MIRTLLYLKAKPGLRDELVAWYRRERSLENAISDANSLGGEIYPLDDGVTLLVTALWSSEADYRNWTSNPWRQATAKQVSQYLQEELGPDQPGLILTSAHSAAV